MDKRIMTVEQMKAFEQELLEEEKSAVTVEKYLRDVRRFFFYGQGKEVNKELLIGYKKELVRQGYAVRSVNSMLASVNSFLRFQGWEDCRVRNLRLQKELYCQEERELTKEEYFRLLKAAESNYRLFMALQTICSTGIRVSELVYFTVEAIRKGEIRVCCKNKIRKILLPGQLRKRLICYARKKGIRSGLIFRTKSGKPLDRSNLWAEMKRLCAGAGVSRKKVFPHNLRKLFARTFYRTEKDMAKLADILGHSSIDTTRIYIAASGQEHRKKDGKAGTSCAPRGGRDVRGEYFIIRIM